MSNNYADLVERLRATCETGADPELIYAAADAIEQLMPQDQKDGMTSENKI